MKLTTKLNEIHMLKDKVDEDTYDCMVCDIEETDDYMEILNNIMLDMKHIISDKLRAAIDCGFDTEILAIDYGMDSDMIEMLQKYEEEELEVKL